MTLLLLLLQFTMSMLEVVAHLLASLFQAACLHILALPEPHPTNFSLALRLAAGGCAAAVHACLPP